MLSFNDRQQYRRANILHGNKQLSCRTISRTSTTKTPNIHIYPRSPQPRRRAAAAPLTRRNTLRIDYWPACALISRWYVDPHQTYTCVLTPLAFLHAPATPPASWGVTEQSNASHFPAKPSGVCRCSCCRTPHSPPDPTTELKAQPIS